MSASDFIPTAKAARGKGPRTKKARRLLELKAHPPDLPERPRRRREDDDDDGAVLPGRRHG